MGFRGGLRAADVLNELLRKEDDRADRTGNLGHAHPHRALQAAKVGHLHGGDLRPARAEDHQAAVDFGLAEAGPVDPDPEGLGVLPQQHTFRNPAGKARGLNDIPHFSSLVPASKITERLCRT